jgi:hypothetical protein
MSFTASWSPSNRDLSNISFSEAALSYASIQSATASNRQHALSHRCHNCKSRQHICSDSAFSVMGPAEQAMMPKICTEGEFFRSQLFDLLHSLYCDCSQSSNAARCCIAHQSAKGPLNSKPAQSHTTLYIVTLLYCEPVTGLLYQIWNAYQAPSHADGSDRLMSRGMHNSSHTLPELLEQKCRSKECVPDQVALVKLTSIEGYRRHPEGLR